MRSSVEEIDSAGDQSICLQDHFLLRSCSVSVLSYGSDMIVTDGGG